MVQLDLRELYIRSKLDMRSAVSLDDTPAGSMPDLIVCRVKMGHM